MSPLTKTAPKSAKGWAHRSWLLCATWPSRCSVWPVPATSPLRSAIAPASVPKSCASSASDFDGAVLSGLPAESARPNAGRSLLGSSASGRHGLDASAVGRSAPWAGPVAVYPANDSQAIGGNGRPVGSGSERNHRSGEVFAAARVEEAELATTRLHGVCLAAAEPFECRNSTLHFQSLRLYAVDACALPGEFESRRLKPHNRHRQA